MVGSPRKKRSEARHCRNQTIVFTSDGRVAVHREPRRALNRPTLSDDIVEFIFRESATDSNLTEKFVRRSFHRFSGELFSGKSNAHCGTR